MKLRTLRIQNVKLLRDFELDFTTADGSPRQWTILVGRNGTGKSTILQAIALAASGGAIANSLVRSDVASYPDRRFGEDDAAPSAITGTFDLSALAVEVAVGPYSPRAITMQAPSFAGPAEVTAKLVLPHDGKLFVADDTHPAGPDSHSRPIRFDWLNSVRSASKPWWFAVGYGTRRFLTIDTRKVDRPHEERVEGLFSTSARPLIGLGFADRQSYSPMFVRRFLDLLKTALVGAEGQEGLTPLIDDVELRRPGGVTSSDLADKDRFLLRLPDGGNIRVPATYLSHGYQSTIAWVADLIGQFLLDFANDRQALRRLSLKSMTGLVLIDELDLFLHPDWQTGFIDALSKTFPNLQFVVTTHSPLLIADRHPSEVVLLGWNDAGDIVPRPFDGDPRLMNTSELYRRIFGLRDTPPTPLAQDVAQYNFMASDPRRDDEEEAEVQRLRAKLDAADVEGLEPLVPRNVQ